MSRALDTWYSLPDLDRLARLGRVLDGEIAIGKLARLAELSGSRSGTVNAAMTVRHRADGRLELRLVCSADVELVCQRCLEPMVCTLNGAVDYLLVEDEQSGATADKGDVEVLALSGERLNPKELIEEELLVSLPFSPRHDDVRSCGSLARTLEELSSDDGNGGPGGTGAVNH